MRPFSFLAALLLLLSSSAWAVPKKLLILGDSITEGYGVAREAAFPALIEKKIKEQKKDWSVINAGVSGSTSASAVSRLKWQLKSKPDLLMLALGANDGLRGLPPKEMEKNISDAIELAQKEKVQIVLVGMMMPPNYSTAYTKEFKEVFPRVAKKYKIKLIPFLLEGVAGKSELNQPDGIHPNEKGHAILADHLFKEIQELL